MVRNYFADLYWFVRSTAFEKMQALHTWLFDYSNIRFAKAHRCLQAYYKGSKLRHSYVEFQTSKKAGDPSAPYGETPLLTMKRLIQGFAINSNHRILELGCGSGRLAFWIASQVGCSVIAVDHAPFFIEAAKRTAQESGFRDHEISFIQVDLVHAPFEKVDIVYFYGLGLGDKLYERLCLRLAQMQNPPWVITIGGPLNEYHEGFCVMQQMPAVFAWGWTNAYLNVFGKKSPD